MIGVDKPYDVRRLRRAAGTCRRPTPRPNHQVHRAQDQDRIQSDFPALTRKMGPIIPKIASRSHDGFQLLGPAARDTKAARLTLTMTLRVFACAELRTQHDVT